MTEGISAMSWHWQLVYGETKIDIELISSLNYRFNTPVQFGLSLRVGLSGSSAGDARKAVCLVQAVRRAAVWNCRSN